MTTQARTLDTIDIISPDHYAANGYPHREWALLRREQPVFWCAQPNFDPFWAITKHADIVNISKQPKLFLNAPRLGVFPLEFDRPAEDNLPFRHLLNMDPPEHAQYRNVINRRFTPRTVLSLETEIERITKDILDEMAGRTECDFVNDVSSKLPLAVIAELLGVPRSDWELLFKWTNETIGATDPEFQQGTSAQETADRARLELFQYFSNMVEQRRAQPTDDIISVVSNAEVNGRPLPSLELLSYFFVLVVAGNETTRNATSGGLLALIENPEEWRQLRADPSLMKSAVEEIVRWTSPVIQFCRTAVEDVELRGQRIRAGESVCLFYPSGNRDEEVFDDPFRFRVDRNPNPHIAFGIGEHFCLGANLARLELEVFFRELVRRLAHAELTGPVSRLRSSFVGGIKHMPIKYKMGAAR